jgi:hypothetical protein
MTQQDIKKNLEQLRKQCRMMADLLEGNVPALMLSKCVMSSLDDIINDISGLGVYSKPQENVPVEEAKPEVPKADKPKRKYHRTCPTGYRILRKSLDGKIIYGGYDTVAEASRLTGINRNGIYRCIVGDKESWGGYVWTRVPYTGGPSTAAAASKEEQ